MNFKNILFVLALISFVFIGCKQEAKKEIATDVLAINISGMTCEIGCAKMIQSKLSKHDGVLDAKVVFKDSIANVKFDAAKTNKASLIAFVGGMANNMYKATEVTSKKSCGADFNDKEKKPCSTKDVKECCKGKEKMSCSGDKKVSSSECKKECCTA